jgi:two-component system response regulator YesN
MPYKVFLVEDEIITREGMRDNVDWRSCGFEFCGEATDGEMAISQLLTIQPDVLITDIKMPFMDGLELSKIVHERLPLVKIIILSGHDEFEYAQKAINLGVAEYLLKPVSAKKLQAVMHKLTLELDQEREEQDRLRKLQEQVEENQAALRERLLFKLVMGTISPTEVIEKGQGLGLDLIARCYLVMIIKLGLVDGSGQYDPDEHRKIQDSLIGRIGKNPDIFLLKRDWGDLILIMKGSTPDYLEEERDLVMDEVKQIVAKSYFQLTIGLGESKKRIADINQSFIEALLNIENSHAENKRESNLPAERIELLKIDKSAVENYLRFGVNGEFEEFFDSYIRPLGEPALKSNAIKNYFFVDIIMATAKLVDELGGDIDKVVPELNSIEAIVAKVKSMEQLREQTLRILSIGLAYRGAKPTGQYKALIRKVKDYIENKYIEPNLTLHDVAAQVNLSASHFSVVFSQETNQTFKEYLTETRINKAKELLQMTGLRSSEIAYKVGYNDPHYFSSVFKKITGVSPIEFRSQK